MGSPCPSIPTMIVGAILTAILIFVYLWLNPESDITTQEMTKQTTTQKTEKQATKKKEETKQDFHPVKEMQVFTKILMIFVSVFAGCNAWFLVKLYKLYAY